MKHVVKPKNNYITIVLQTNYIHPKYLTSQLKFFLPGLDQVNR